MRFDTSQHMQMGQQMKLAPRMIQSMEILQMPLAALQERIDQELESNIALELADPTTTDAEVQAELLESRLDDTRGERELVVDGDAGAADDFERLTTMESEYGEAFDNEYSSQRYVSSRLQGERDGKLDALANVAARGASLTDQLLEQWRLCDVDEETERLGALLIEHIDDNGMLASDLEEIADRATLAAGPAATVADLESALEEIQSRLDPPGIGARSRRESLLIQIDRLVAEGEDDDPVPLEALRELIEDHYDDLLQNRLPRVGEATGLSMDEIRAALGQMRRLSLSPGRRLVEVDVPPIVPDVIIELDPETGELTARLCDELVPSLRLSTAYQDMARDRGLDKDTRQFVGDNVRRAAWLLDAIAQRKHTLMRVVKVVLLHQSAFFEQGPQALRPLPMGDVADQLGVHVATISRAVSDKWLLTPQGLVPLRMFFSGGTERGDGRDMSWEAVRATLKEVVEAEDKSRPLSDDAGAKLLRERGIDIARRTVVKYRQQLGIPPARHRRVFA